MLASTPSRRFLTLSGLWLVGIGVATPQILSTQTDNVYLWLVVLALLAPVGVLFLAAAAAPEAARRWLWRAGSWLLWVVGALAVPLLGLGLAIVLFQGSTTVGPVASYGLAFLGVLTTLYVIRFRPLRASRKTPV